MSWIPIELVPHNTFVLINAEGELPTVAKKISPNAWQLAEIGGYAEDSDPSYKPTHFMHIPQFD